MADHSSPAVPDYGLDDHLTLDATQTQALVEPTRMAIIDLLNERAATTSQLADALGKPKGTIGHHAKVLEDAGLIHVVRTEKVRAIEAKYYGRTARIFLLPSLGEAGVRKGFMLAEAATEIEAGRESGLHDDHPAVSAVRYARIPGERAEEWRMRLVELVSEFTGQERDGDTVYGMAVALFPTTRPSLERT